MKKLVILCVVLAAAVGVAAFDLAQLETAVTDAKLAYVADPSAHNLADLEAAVAAFQEAIPAPAKGARAMAGETEPNDTAGTANTVADDDYVQADISPAGDVDYFANGGNGIQDLVFAAVATIMSSAGGDSQLNTYANDGTTLIEFDDDSGPILASCVAGGIVPQAGDVYFAVNEFGNDGEITPYELFQVVAPASDSMVEAEPNNDAGTATPITATFVNGSLSAVALDTDFYSFPADAGDVIEAIMDEDPDADVNPAHTVLSIIDTDGVTVLANGDNNSFNDNNCAGSAVAPSTGTYYVSVSDGGAANDNDYRLTVVVDGRSVPVELMSFSVE
jgi:hypothetical protein